MIGSAVAAGGLEFLLDIQRQPLFPQRAITDDDNPTPFDAAHPRLGASSEERHRRRTLVAAGGHALWMFVVQREACGLRDSRSVMRDYQVPAEVQEQMGVFPATQ